MVTVENKTATPFAVRVEGIGIIQIPPGKSQVSEKKWAKLIETDLIKTAIEKEQVKASLVSEVKEVSPVESEVEVVEEVVELPTPKSTKTRKTSKKST